MTENHKELLAELIKSRDLAEISVFQSIKELEELGVEPGDSLIDSEGFPRGDIDLYKIRFLRSSIATQQNNHKTIMKKIEILLPLVIPSNCEKLNSSFTKVSDDIHLRPFAKIGIVPTESVAFKSGVCTNDLVVKFGGLLDETFKSKNLNEFRDEFNRFKVSGEVLEMKLKRGNENEKIETIKLDLNSKMIDSLGCQILLL